MVMRSTTTAELSEASQERESRSSFAFQADQRLTAKSTGMASIEKYCWLVNN